MAKAAKKKIEDGPSETSPRSLMRRLEALQQEFAAAMQGPGEQQPAPADGAAEPAEELGRASTRGRLA